MMRFSLKERLHTSVGSSGSSVTVSDTVLSLHVTAGVGVGLRDGECVEGITELEEPVIMELLELFTPFVIPRAVDRNVVFGEAETAATRRLLVAVLVGATRTFAIKRLLAAAVFGKSETVVVEETETAATRRLLLSVVFGEAETASTRRLLVAVVVGEVKTAARRLLVGVEDGAICVDVTN